MATVDPVIAIVDDDEAVRRALKRLVGSLRYQTADFSCGEDFLDSLDRLVPICMLLDLYMPGFDGLQVLAAMQAQGLDIPTIVITGNPRREMRELCMEAGAAAYLLKPLDRELVLSTIRTVTA
jgi:FixJ family two-component response regulator